MYINVKEFIKENKELSFYELSKKFEEHKAKTYLKGKEEGVFFTKEEIVNNMLSNLDIKGYKNKKEITILEPSVGSGNFLPAIFNKFKILKSKINLTINDIDKYSLEFIKESIKLGILAIPDNFNIDYLNEDFFTLNVNKNFDFIIGNPPYGKIKDKEIKKYFENKKTNNMFAFFIEKSISIADNLSFIVPKGLLYVKQFNYNREQLKGGIYELTDYGKFAFTVNLETISFSWSKNKTKNIIISNYTEKETIKHDKEYIFNKEFPIWLIYRNKDFDKTLNKMNLGVFSTFRDRQITNKLINKEGMYQVLKGKNIDKNKIKNIEGYDDYITDIDNLVVKKFLDKENVLCIPNLTNNIRFCRLPKGKIVNGAVALIYKENFDKIDNKTIDFLNSEEFKEFFQIIKNKSNLSVNIDDQVGYFIGELK